MGSRQEGPKTRCQLRRGFSHEAHTWTLVSLVLLLVIVLDGTDLLQPTVLAPISIAPASAASPTRFLPAVLARAQRVITGAPNLLDVVTDVRPRPRFAKSRC